MERNGKTHHRVCRQECRPLNRRNRRERDSIYCSRKVPDFFDLYCILDDVTSVVRFEGPLIRLLWLQKKPWTEQSASGVMAQLLRAVRRVHKKGFIHGDVAVSLHVLCLMILVLTLFFEAWQHSLQG